MEGLESPKKLWVRQADFATWMCWVIRILPLQGSGRAQDMSKTVNVSTIYELHIVLRAHLTNQIQIRLLMIDTMMRTTSMTMDHTGDLCIEGQHRVLQV